MKTALKQNKSLKIVLAAVIALVLIVLPNCVSSDYMVRVINNALLYSVIAMSANLLMGFCGLLDFGRSAFCATGAYWSAILMMKLNVPFIIAFLTAGLFSAACGMLLGLVSKNAGGDFMTLMTIAFNEIVRLLVQNLKGLTGGTVGLYNIPSVQFFGIQLNTHRTFYYFALVLAILSFVILRIVTKSKMGRAFEAIRDDEIAASFSGIDTGMYRVYCFAVASFFTGLAGAAMAHYANFASPLLYTTNESLIILQMAVLGGLASLPGSVVGAFIIVIVPELSRTFYEYRMLFTGVIMLLLMLFCPDGLFGKQGVGKRVIGLAFGRKKKNEGQTAGGGK